MLKLKNITKQYHVGDIQIDALKGINLEFRKSEFVAVLGPSGCGKTTLLNIIGGLDRYTDGDIVIDGISTKRYKDADWDIYRNHSIGFVFQSYNLIPHQSVLDNVALAMTLAGVSSEERKARATSALEKVGLGDQIKKKPNQLSGGQMQRVAIARALVNNPEILLADEPTGALDSATSLQVMEIIKEISKDRLVIMVTHNPELATKYATRTVLLSDGLVTEDSLPYDSGLVPPKEKGQRKKISMSFLTALGLSFSNLLTKKGRTAMTAFAGSIGIIGIALILALANGVNGYIQNTEEDMLSIYPLTIQNQGMNFASLMMAAQDENDGSKATNTSKGKLQEAPMVAGMFSRVGTNDLAALKKYLDSGKSGIEKNVNAVQYSYNITPQIFSPDTSDGIKKINPNEAFAAMGFSSTKSSSSLLNASMNMNTFYELAEDTDLFQGQYDVVAGKWPQKYNECLVVLTSSGRIPDMLLYQLGFRDSKVLEQMVQDFMDGKQIEKPASRLDISYDKILSKKMTVIPNVAYYKHNSQYKVWEDMSGNETYMKHVIKKGETLNIVGIVKPSGDSKTTALNPGVYYTSALTHRLMAEAAHSKIVEEQLASPKVDVFTGKTFKEEAKKNSDTGLDFSSMFTVDTTKMQTAFSIDTDKLYSSMSNYFNVSNLDLSDLENINLPMPNLDDVDFASAVDVQKAETLVNDLTQDFIDNGGGMTFAEYLTTKGAQDILNAQIPGIVEGSDLQAQVQEYLESYTAEVVDQLTKAVTAQLQATMNSAIANLRTALPAAMKIDQQKFADAFKLNMDQADLSSLLKSLLTTKETSYDSNLLGLGYAKLSKPYSISIYPKDFESKQNVIKILDNYNSRMEKEGHKSKVITYTDIVGALMSSLNKIVDVISYVLIAFVAISLVVSSIMIGIITYISVLERKKEIGILRSIGASKGDIARVFNAETIIIGFAAGVLAIIVALVVSVAASAIVYSKFNIPDVAVLPALAAVILVGISVFLTFVAGLIPSGAAARKDPVEALRSE